MVSSARSRADRHGRDETILEHCFFPRESNEDQRNHVQKVCSNKPLKMASLTTVAGGHALPPHPPRCLLQLPVTRVSVIFAGIHRP